MARALKVHNGILARFLILVKPAEIFFYTIIMDKDNKIGSRIKTLRVEIGINQETLAQKLGLDRGTISKMERGENFPTYKTLIELKRIFNVSIDWLLTGEGFKYPMDRDDEYDDNLKEMIHDLKNNETAKIKVLSFFYSYKAKHLSQFINPKKKIADKR